MLTVSEKPKGFWDHIGNIGGAMVTAAAGYTMTRFEARPNLPWEKNMVWPVRIAGYVLLAYGIYDGLRDWIDKGQS